MNGQRGSNGSTEAAEAGYGLRRSGSIGARSPSLASSPTPPARPPPAGGAQPSRGAPLSRDEIAAAVAPQAEQHERRREHELDEDRDGVEGLDREPRQVPEGRDPVDPVRQAERLA